MPTDVLIVNLVILGVVLWADVGTGQITRRRVLRLLIISVIAVAIFVKSPQTSGNGLALELVGFATGLILGAIEAHRLMRITRDPEPTSRSASRARHTRPSGFSPSARGCCSPTEPTTGTANPSATG